jgi:hypothetical protein
MSEEEEIRVISFTSYAFERVCCKRREGIESSSERRDLAQKEARRELSESGMSEGRLGMAILSFTNKVRQNAIAFGCCCCEGASERATPDESEEKGEDEDEDEDDDDEEEEEEEEEEGERGEK